MEPVLRLGKPSNGSLSGSPRRTGLAMARYPPDRSANVSAKARLPRRNSNGSAPEPAIIPLSVDSEHSITYVGRLDDRGGRHSPRRRGGTMTVDSGKNLAAVLAMIERGWHILPCHSIRDGACTCGKDCDSPGKHPMTRNGLKDARCDPEWARAVWEDTPWANIAVRTGPESQGLGAGCGRRGWHQRPRTLGG